MALLAARGIIIEKGVGALSTRRLAERIGYTSGTLYQIFRNRDDLVDQVNTATLAMLYDHCSAGLDGRSAQDGLRHLAKGFLSFAEAHPQEWDAVINYPFAAGHETPLAYGAQIERLLGLLCGVIAEFYDPAVPDQPLRDARLLWNSLYGIFALASAGRLSEERGPGEAVEDLIALYLAARA